MKAISDADDARRQSEDAVVADRETEEARFCKLADVHSKERFLAADVLTNLQNSLKDAKSDAAKTQHEIVTQTATETEALKTSLSEIQTALAAEEEKVHSLNQQYVMTQNNNKKTIASKELEIRGMQSDVEKLQENISRSKQEYYDKLFKLTASHRSNGGAQEALQAVA